MARVTIPEGQLQSLKRVAITANHALEFVSRELIKQAGKDPATCEPGFLSASYPESTPYVEQHLKALALHDDAYGLTDIGCLTDEEIADLQVNEKAAADTAKNAENPFDLDEVLADPEVFMRDSILTVLMLTKALAGTLTVLKKRFPNEDIALTEPGVQQALVDAREVQSMFIIKFGGASDDYFEKQAAAAEKGSDIDTW